MANPLAYPFDEALLTRKRRALKAELSAKPPAIETRIALLGGSTTSELKEFLELFLLDAGIKPLFYESEFGKFEEEVILDDKRLKVFKPHIAVIHTTWHNARLPEPLEPDDVVEQRVSSEAQRFEAIWTKLESLDCTVIQNNFDRPHERSLGHLDSTQSYGRASFLRRLNVEFAKAARRHPRTLINDIDHLSASFGLDKWHNRGSWFSYKLAVSPTGTISLAHNVAAIIRAVYGRTKKVLILDLDNTLWGGVIGDDGLTGIALGNETPAGEAYTAIQRYCVELKKRGILLAVCSKNEPANAQEGFTHPDSVLKLEDFSAFKASWNPKHDAIVEMAHELNLGLDSFVFLDDNPAERAIVSAQLPMVSVPDIGDDPSRFIEILDAQRYFEPLGISQDDLKRSEMYASNVQRNLASATYASYGEFLDSLQMKAEIAPFSPVYMDRIVQLTNKSNQFNLTTRRCTQGEMEAMRTDGRTIALYGRLADKFGDNGLITVVVGREEGDELIIDLWLMSCRVLKRDMENAMLDELVSRAKARGLRRIRGMYLPTKKNGLVAEHYSKLGFEPMSKDDKGSEWRLDLRAPYEARNTHIKEILRG